MRNKMPITRIVNCLADDMAETFEALSVGSCPKSVTWRIFRNTPCPGKTYDLNNLESLLTDVRKGDIDIGTMRYTKGDVEHAKNNPDLARHFDNASVINFADFIYGCCHDKMFLDTWLDEIIVVTFAPHQIRQDERFNVKTTMTGILYHVHDAIHRTALQGRH